MRGTVEMLLVLRRLDKNSPMALDSMICMEIFGSGPQTGMDAVIHSPRQTRTVAYKITTARGVEAFGTAIRTACECRTDLGTTLSPATTPSDFAWVCIPKITII